MRLLVIYRMFTEKRSSFRRGERFSHWVNDLRIVVFPAKLSNRSVPSAPSLRNRSSPTSWQQQGACRRRWAQV